MNLKLLEKTPFDIFYSTFLEMPYEARKDVLEALSETCPIDFSMEEKLQTLFYDVYCRKSDSDWKELFEGLGTYDKTLEFD